MSKTSAACHNETDGHQQHLLQFYTEDLSLTRDVGRYLAEGMLGEERIVVIATSDHMAAFKRELENDGLDVVHAVDDRRLLFLDARETLTRFMVDGQPDRQRFEDTVGELVRELRTRTPGKTVRAYGEMVDLLWNSGCSEAALRLEQYWNELLAANEFSLLCAYQIDVFSNEFQAGVLDRILRAHTHLVPARNNDSLNSALHASMNDVLGTAAEALKVIINANVRPSWAGMPHAEATILWLRNNLPAYADEIMCRAEHNYRVALETGLSDEYAS